MASEANFTFEAVFFDLDGTLYDKRGLGGRMVWTALLRGRLRAGGPRKPLKCIQLMALERKARRLLAGRKASLDDLFAEIARRSKLTPEAIRAWYYEWFMSEMAYALKTHYTLNSNVLAKVRMFKEAGVKVAILSDYDCVREKFKALGGDPALFDALLDAPSLGGFKPCPDVFRAACASLGVDPARSAMLGDRPDTDGGCVAVGMTYIPK
ncbi:MAG: HAD family hydrolase [Bacteroidales bacterium]|nr:HAD family hydrolase [Bacteroidales bacterium]